MKKALLLVLILVLATSCITFTACDPYNIEIKFAYEKVKKELVIHLHDDGPYSIDHKTIKIHNIIFGDLDEEDNIFVDIYYTATTIHHTNTGSTKGNELQFLYVYKLAVQYYNALVDANNSGDVLKYLEALNACFKNMKYYREEASGYSNDLELDENQAQQFNEIFFAEWGEDQGGFLPYFIERTEINDIEEGNYDTEYRFIVKGFNFVKNSNGTFKLPSNTVATILTLDAAKGQVDVYEQELEVSFKFDFSKLRYDNDKWFSGLMRRYLDGQDVAVSFNTVRTQKVDVTEKFIKMTMGQFDFEQPANAQ